MADLTLCDACGQEHPGAADEWGVYGAPNGRGGHRERLLCPQCASAVVSLFGSRGAQLEAVGSSVASGGAPTKKKPRQAAAGARSSDRRQRGQKR